MDAVKGGTTENCKLAARLKPDVLSVCSKGQAQELAANACATVAEREGVLRQGAMPVTCAARKLAQLCVHHSHSRYSDHQISSEMGSNGP